MSTSPIRDDSPLASLLPRAPRCLRLAELPTPVERAPWLDGPAAEVWVKRDDASSAVYGGGKVRKLELVLGNPPHDGDAPIVSIGGLGSHHLLALALFLRPLGRTLHAWTFDQVMTPHVRTNLAVLMSCGARLWSVRSRAALPWAALGYYVWARPPQMGRWMTPGASSPLGALGFVAAGLELAQQIEAGALPRPARVYITGGSAGSSAGLLVGLALAGVGTHLRVVSAVEPLFFNSFALRGLARKTLATLRQRGLPAQGGLDGLLARAGVTWSIDHRQVGPGYAVPTPAGAAEVERAASHGLKLETTYTGKCAAALRADLESGDARGPVLLWNTHAGNELRARIEDGWERRLPPRVRALL
ncbi:MAG: pyridoxal-phosphate dependent enzyme [Myxococcales bacterium]|nr:pyridoxal-phosphate dependent enzyme [Myxococcales bacterium]